ncbi:MAG: family 43 glycosylhydrolase [Bacteroidales bacterium]|nr:family 43 glycosylhydrolase [Bacteroidales bacterium]
MKHLLLLLLAMTATLPTMAQDEIEMTTAEARSLKSLYDVTTTKSYAGAHDPSIVYDHTRNRYYIFGTHQSWAWTSDLQNWKHIGAWWAPANNIYSDFNTNQTKTVKVGGVTKTFGNFNAQAWAAAYGGDYNIGGNLWAPAVIWNKKMQKWCQYLSVNGPHYNSVIIMLTANSIEGPYTYQGPVVYSGFGDTGVAALSWRNTDVPLVLGSSVTSLPARYNINMGAWGGQWLNCIDPCVYYDKDDNLYMVYGSWFGGLYILELDEDTGLRDYNVNYGSDYDTRHQACTRDPYFGIKAHGGFSASGEGPFIERIGDYYFLFVSNGGLEQKGGYQMRVFRSANPRGPFVDSRGVSAVLDNWVNNFGVNPDTRGEKILGPFNYWGFQTNGEVAQGHNSIIAAPDGRTYLIYHTRFTGSGEMFQDRVHQVFLNEDNWLVASPFEYNGEQITDADIASTQSFEAIDVVGTYEILIHKYSIDHANLEVVTPVKITLNENGKVSGAYTGTWSLVPGTSYFHITIDGVLYKGVIYEEIMDGKAIHTVSFSAMAFSGVNVWGYKYHPKYALAMQLNGQTVPVHNNLAVSSSIDLMTMMETDVENIRVEWTSDHPDIISDYGRYDPSGLTEDTPVNLTVRVSSGRYFWTQTCQVNAVVSAMPEGDFSSGMMAYYCFDETPISNAFNTTETASRSRAGSGSRPLLKDGYVRSGKVIHTTGGTKGNESYVLFTNPLYQQTLDEGMTIAFWVKLTEADLVNPLIAFTDGTKRFYLTGNSHISFTDGDANNFDINHPDNLTPGLFTPGEWTFVTLTVSREDGIRLYLNGSRKTLRSFVGKMDGTSVRQSAFNYNLVVDQLLSTHYFYFGYGTPNGSPDASYDDLFIFNRVLLPSDVSALRVMANRVYDFNQLATGIAEVQSTKNKVQGDDVVYDLQGRRVGTSLDAVGQGIYIYRGKKVLVK